MAEKVVVVTGACGFIGRYTSRFCAQKGYVVVGMGYGTWDEPEWKRWGLHQWIQSDISINALKANIEDPYMIIHCAGAGSVGVSFDRPLDDYNNNVGTLLNVLEFVRLYFPDTKITYPSSGAVYGSARHLPVIEEADLNPVSPYGFNKKIAEDLCRSYAFNYNLSIAVVRLFSIYGAGLEKQVLWDACEKARQDNPVFFGTGNESRDFIHVDDAAELLYLAAEKASSKCPVFNGGAGVNVKIRDIVEKLYYFLDYKKSPCFSEQQRDGDPLHYQADISKAYALGWQPQIDLDTGINDYVNWYKDFKK